MKRKNRAPRIILAFIAMFTAIFVIHRSEVQASAPGVLAPELIAEKSADGTQIIVSLKATENTNFGGWKTHLDTYDTGTFTLSTRDVTWPISSVTGNLNTGLFTADTGDDETIAIGDSIIKFAFSITDTIEKNKDYPFQITMSLAYDYDVEDYFWCNETFSVVYRENEYTVTFDTDGGSTAPDAQTVDENDTATKPSTDPTKDGYTFKYWSDTQNGTTEFDFDNTPITANTTLYAVWEGNTVTHTVTFDATDGTPTPDAQTVEDGETATKPASDPGKDGFTFQYWSAEEDGDEFDFATPITGDTTLYAVWEQDTADLKISNTMSGTPSGQTPEPVTYTIKFTAPTEDSINPKDSDENGEFDYGEEYTFTLDLNEGKTFTVPVGASYTITVTGTPNYETAVTVTSDGTAANPVDNSANIGDDVTANGTVGGSGDNKVEVTNTYAITPLTGILTHRDMLIVIGLAALAIIGGLVISRKVRKV